MCGIAGIVAFPDAERPTPERIRRMCDRIVHRGPDDEGIEVNGGVGLGMRRLAVIDLAGGRQPIANEDGTVTTVFNGEIYNYRELRRELESMGHTFATSSDTEVIVHAYEQYGEDFPNRLNGMFAIALHDRRNDLVYLVRDHVGVKPLFYCANGSHVTFGSEIKALLASGLVERELDVDAMAEFLTWEYVPGHRTLFRSVKKLEAGHLLKISVRDGDVSVRQYWDIPAGEPSRRSADEWEALADRAIRAAVERQLVSDVPLGAFLSGGVDSSLVVAAMGDAETFSIGFEDPSYNELAFAESVAAHLQTRHISRTIEPDVVELFDHLMTFLDDPIGDFSIFPTYLISRLAREHVTVALSGDGGDELFGGYETYVAGALGRPVDIVPNPVRRLIFGAIAASIPPQPSKKGFVNKLQRFSDGLSLPRALGHARWRLFLHASARDNLLTREAADRVGIDPFTHIYELYEKSQAFSQDTRALYVDTRSYLVDNCLVKTDRMSMAVSLEARVPLLDRELVELAFALPDRYKVNGTKTKVLLKRIAARYVPANCVYRPKEGFSIPIKNWLAERFRPMLMHCLDPQRIKVEGIFNADTVGRLISEHFGGRANHSHILWSLVVFQSWRERWLEGPV